jgi:hypothetical protein
MPANDPCNILLGLGWRIPTYSEWTNADATAGWNNYNDTYASVLKLHAAGRLYGSGGSLYDLGSLGSYWSSTQNSNILGWDLFIDLSYSTMFNNGKAYGLSVRCLKD